MRGNAFIRLPENLLSEGIDTSLMDVTELHDKVVLIRMGKDFALLSFVGYVVKLVVFHAQISIDKTRREISVNAPLLHKIAGSIFSLDLIRADISSISLS